MRPRHVPTYVTLMTSFHSFMSREIGLLISNSGDKCIYLPLINLSTYITLNFNLTPANREEYSLIYNYLVVNSKEYLNVNDHLDD